MIDSRRRFVLVSAGALTFALALFACSDETSPNSEFGVYSLITANAKSLPATIVDTVITGQGAVKLVWVAGTVDLQSNNTWKAIITQTLTFFGTTSTTPDTSTGTWSRSGNIFTLVDPTNPTQNVTATLSGNDLTASVVLTDLNKAVIAVFRK